MDHQDSIAFSHDFGQASYRPAEKQTFWVAMLTVVTMVIEITAGWLTGSMALLADGIHMGSHTLALGGAAIAYYLTRRNAHNRHFSLGSGKINDLVAYSSTLFLILFTFFVMVESVERLFNPQPLNAAQAMFVAGFGMVVNLASFFLLSSHGHGHHHHEHHHHEDNNLKAAILHIIADVMTSVAAIIGIGVAWLWGWWWLDPIIALVASLVILRWGLSLLKQTSSVLLDREIDSEKRLLLEGKLQDENSKLIDLHCWSVGQGAWTMTAAIIHSGSQSPKDFRQRLSGLSWLHHPIIEVHYI